MQARLELNAEFVSFKETEKEQKKTLEYESLFVNFLLFVNFQLKDQKFLFENCLLSAVHWKKSEKVFKLKSLPRNYNTEFYISKLCQIDDGFVSQFQRNLVSKI